MPSVKRLKNRKNEKDKAARRYDRLPFASGSVGPLFLGFIPVDGKKLVGKDFSRTEPDAVSNFRRTIENS